MDDLFDTSPPARPEPQRPVTVSPEMRMRLVGRIQDLRLEHRGDPPAMAADKRERLEAALASGDAVEVKLSQGGLGRSAVSAILKKSDDLEASTSFFLKTSGGFAGVQLFGPFDL